MNSEQLLLIVTLIVGIAGPFFLFVSGALALIFQTISSDKKRKWDVEDRREERKQLAAKVKKATTAAELAVKHAEASVTHAESSRAELNATLAVVGEQAQMAYKESNQANLKIQAVQDALTAVVGLPQKDVTASTAQGRENETKSK